jgi:hypothetical protein
MTDGNGLIPRDRALRFDELASEQDRNRLVSFVAAELYLMAGEPTCLPDLLRVPHVEDGFSALRAWVAGQMWIRGYWTIDSLFRVLRVVMESA